MLLLFPKTVQMIILSTILHVSEITVLIHECTQCHSDDVHSYGKILISSTVSNDSETHEAVSQSLPTFVTIHPVRIYMLYCFIISCDFIFLSPTNVDMPITLTYIITVISVRFKFFIQSFSYMITTIINAKATKIKKKKVRGGGIPHKEICEFILV